jgi:hypothetical protein
MSSKRKMMDEDDENETQESPKKPKIDYKELVFEIVTSNVVAFERMREIVCLLKEDGHEEMAKNVMVYLLKEDLCSAAKELARLL